MSRSHKKTSIIGHTLARSEKIDKRLANRALRRVAEKISESTLLESVEIKPRLKNGAWLFDKDGKQYIHQADFELNTFRKLVAK